MMDRLWCQPGAHTTEQPGLGVESWHKQTSLIDGGILPTEPWLAFQAFPRSPCSSHCSLLTLACELNVGTLPGLAKWFCTREGPAVLKLSVSPGQSTSECQRPTCVAKVDMPLTPHCCPIQIYFCYCSVSTCLLQEDKGRFWKFNSVPNLCRQTWWPPAIAPHSLCPDLCVHHLS